MSSASACALASRSCRLGADGVGAGSSRKAKLSCIATLLIGRRHLRWNQTATEKSIHNPSYVEQIRQRCEAGIAMFRRR